MAVLGLRFCVRALSSCGKQGPLFIAVRGPLTVAASLVAEHANNRERESSSPDESHMGARFVGVRLCFQWLCPAPLGPAHPPG